MFTLKLRWLIRRNKVTSQEVLEYRDKYGISLNAARIVLEDAKPPVLQCRVFGRWLDVPIVVIPHKPN